MARACFPNVSQFPIRETLFPCQFLFPRCKLCLRYTAGNINKNPSMRAVAKKFRARASEHSSNFCEQFWSKGQILRAISNWMGPLDTPIIAIPENCNRTPRPLGWSCENKWRHFCYPIIIGGFGLAERAQHSTLGCENMTLQCWTWSGKVQHCVTYDR